MNRLTYRNDRCATELYEVVGSKHMTCAELCRSVEGCKVCPLNDALNRLGQYEDTGMLPDEIMELIRKTKVQERLQIKLDQEALMPVRAHASDAGLDILSPVDCVVPPHDRVSVNTGVHVAIPEGYVGMISSKSGLMKKRGITSRGTIDSGYTGSIQAVLINHSDTPYYVQRGDKITQLVVVPCLTPELELVQKLDSTERGDRGFGSTGR